MPWTDEEKRLLGIAYLREFIELAFPPVVEPTKSMELADWASLIRTHKPLQQLFSFMAGYGKKIQREMFGTFDLANIFRTSLGLPRSVEVAEVGKEGVFTFHVHPGSRLIAGYPSKGDIGVAYHVHKSMGMIIRPHELILYDPRYIDEEDFKYELQRYENTQKKAMEAFKEYEIAHLAGEEYISEYERRKIYYEKLMKRRMEDLFGERFYRIPIPKGTQRIAEAGVRVFTDPTTKGIISHVMEKPTRIQIYKWAKSLTERKFPDVGERYRSAYGKEFGFNLKKLKNIKGRILLHLIEKNYFHYQKGILLAYCETCKDFYEVNCGLHFNITTNERFDAYVEIMHNIPCSCGRILTVFF